MPKTASNTLSSYETLPVLTSFKPDCTSNVQKRWQFRSWGFSLIPQYPTELSRCQLKTFGLNRFSR